MKKQIKHTGFTLIEIVIALAMFSVLTMSFYFVMANIYNNSKIEFHIGKKVFSSIENLERAATMVSDLEIESGDKMALALKNEIENNVLNKHGDVKYIDTFEIFAAQGYKSKVDAYFISREINVGETLNEESSMLTPDEERNLPRDTDQKDYYIYIVANDKKKEMRIPEYEYIKILEKRPGKTQGIAVDYTYFNKIKDGGKLVGSFKLNPETKDELYYEKYSWEFSKRKDKNGKYFLPSNSIKPANPQSHAERVLSTKGDNYLNGAEIIIDEDDPLLSYPYGSGNYEDFKRNNIFFKSSRSITHDAYLRFNLEPVAKSMVRLSTQKTNAIWVLALPVTDRLLYHFDMSLAVTSSTRINGTTVLPNAKTIRDLSSSIYDEASGSRYFEPLASNTEIPLFNEFSWYGRYIKLPASDNLIFKNPRTLSGSNNRLNYFLFLVVDTAGANSGTIYKQLDASKNDAFRIDFEGANTFSMKSKHASISDNNTKKGLNRDRHIIVIRAKDDGWSNSITYQMSVDGMDLRSPAELYTEKKSTLNSPLVLGGAAGLKVKEILAYETDFIMTSDEIMKMGEVYTYLHNKHIN